MTSFGLNFATCSSHGLHGFLFTKDHSTKIKDATTVMFATLKWILKAQSENTAQPRCPQQQLSTSESRIASIFWLLN